MLPFYLVGSDGHYVRDPKSGKPMIYDAADQKAKSYDDPAKTLRRIAREFGAAATYSILVNEEAAKAKGIRDGEEVWLESPVCKVKVRAKLTQCIHPQVVGVGGHFGHWSAGMPIARGKGISFNSLLPTDLEHIDKISTALDHCVQVRLYK